MNSRTIPLAPVAFLIATTLPTASAQVFVSDVIIQGSACIGFDCVSGEPFGFDTLRLKENNLRFHFLDTSTSASFPSNDWRIIANDSSNGGGNYLAIEDSTAARQVFRVDAGAPANSLRIDSGGDVGIGESNPVLELHVQDGDSPALRLEQDGSQGFTPQTWDVAGNEANFFVRDVTNGSDLPFRIFPNPGSDALTIAGGGNVGVGTTTPDTKLEVRSTTTQALKLVNANGGVNLQMDGGDTGNFWNITAQADSGGKFVINNNDGPGSVEFTLDAAGNLKIEGTCIEFDDANTACTAAGGALTCAAGSCP